MLSVMLLTVSPTFAYRPGPTAIIPPVVGRCASATRNVAHGELCEQSFESSPLVATKTEAPAAAELSTAWNRSSAYVQTDLRGSIALQWFTMQRIGHNQYVIENTA